MGAAPVRRFSDTISLFKIFLCVMTVGTLANAHCPKACNCKWKDGKKTVICKEAGLILIPETLDKGTQVLDFTKNNLQSLHNDVFKLANLLNLQKIFLNDCRINQIEKKAFNGLSNLMALDLSNNRLTFVPSHALEAIQELRQLKLNGNPISRIANNAFRLVRYLETLELSDCNIGTIENKAFQHLNNLRFLKLDGNRLTNIRQKVVFPINNLAGLHLHNNPWKCDCSLRPLRLWMKKYNVPYGAHPTCDQPSRLHATSWENLQLDDFACKPQTHPFMRLLSVSETMNATLSCVVSAEPEASLHWEKDGVRINVSVGHGYRYAIRTQGTEKKTSNLTIINANKSSAGDYSCIGENKAGKDMAWVTLKISKRIVTVRANKEFAVGLIMVSIIALIVMFIATCIICVKRRRKAYYRSVGDAEESQRNHKPHTSAKYSSPSEGAKARRVAAEVKPVENHVQENSTLGKYHILKAGDATIPDKVQEVEKWLLRNSNENMDNISDSISKQEEMSEIEHHNKDSASVLKSPIDESEFETHRPILYDDDTKSSLELPRVDKDGYRSPTESQSSIVSGLADGADLSSSGGKSRSSKQSDVTVIPSHYETDSIQDLPPSSVATHKLPLVPERTLPSVARQNSCQAAVERGTFSEPYCTLPRRFSAGNQRRSKLEDNRNSPDPFIYTNPKEGMLSQRTPATIFEMASRYRSPNDPPLMTRGTGHPPRRLPKKPVRGGYSNTMTLPSGIEKSRFPGVNPSLPSSPTEDLPEPSTSAIRASFLEDLPGGMPAAYEDSEVELDGASVSYRKKPYDEHARELQKFLDEYQTLQEQLRKVKMSYARTRRQSLQDLYSHTLMSDEGLLSTDTYGSVSHRTVLESDQSGPSSPRGLPRESYYNS